MTATPAPDHCGCAPTAGAGGARRVQVPGGAMLHPGPRPAYEITTRATPHRYAPHHLTVVYDERCELCRRARDWLATQPTYVDLELLAAGSVEAAHRYGSLPWLGQELVIVAEEGQAWIGPAAFIVAIWSTRQYRHWSYRLSGPAFAPMAERFFHLISAKRARIGAALGSPTCTYCARPGVRS